MKRLFTALLPVLIPAFSAVVLVPGSAAAGNSSKEFVCAGANAANNASAGCSDTSGDLNNIIEVAINLFSVVIGIVAVIMIIVGGFKYITSGGDSGKLQSAKHTIVYAIIGLIIVALAQTLVRFVLQKAT